MKELLILLIPTIIIIIVVLVKKNEAYKKSTYYQITKLPYFSVKYNTGRNGEHLTYKHLKQFETSGARFLFNIYVPKENGETTEIDLLMICKKGLFVFESKNYSGWIFGSEKQKNWYQTLPAGRGRSHKEPFYNPIIQNRTHIKYLNTFLGEKVPMWSIIVFSDRCTLKRVQVFSNDIRVINRYSVASVVAGICNQASKDLLTDKDIMRIYNKLYPCTQVDEIAKIQHLANIHDYSNPQYTQQVNEFSTQVISPTKMETDNEQITTDNIKQQVLQCPRCNGYLILRTAKRGANAGRNFYGCSNYPKCKYIRNIIE